MIVTLFIYRHLIADNNEYVTVTLFLYRHLIADNNDYMIVYSIADT